MLAACVTVLRRQRPYTRASSGYKDAYESGTKFWHDLYGDPLVEELRTRLDAGEWQQVQRDLLVLLRHYPRGFARACLNVRSLPRYVRHKLGTWRRHTPPKPGSIRFGSLRRVTPVSDEFGYDRGQPIDRYYIENFLVRQANDIRGRVLEIGDDTYTRRFGGDRVTVSDVLHVSEGNPLATIVADLTRADSIPSDAFDCIILTQTLHLIYEPRSALQSLHRILKPGGVLLATFPGISQISLDQWGDSWYWGFTTRSARRMLEDVFGSTDVVTVEAHGNVLVALSFLHGLAVQELRKEELDHLDRQYEVLITLRAVKREEPDGSTQS
jgi:SAM-dependent methyltransferase